MHIRASQWYEDNGLEIEAFHHAAAANDIERAERLIEGEGDAPALSRRGGPCTELAGVAADDGTGCQALVVGDVCLGVTDESAKRPASKRNYKLLKRCACKAPSRTTRPETLSDKLPPCRATLALTQYQVETIIAQSRRALEYLHPDNLPVRTATTWTLGYAYQLQGDRAAASQAYTEAISISQASGNIITTMVATIGLGNIQEAENQLYLAAETYRRVLQLAGDPPLPIACEAHLGLARIFYEWNDLDAAEQHGQQSLQLARQI